MFSKSQPSVIRYLPFFILALLLSTGVPAAAQIGDDPINGSDSAEESTTNGTSWFVTDTISGNIEVGDFVVGPGRAEVSLEPGESVIEYITVTNRISDNRTFSLTIEDIAGTDDASASVELTGSERGPYSLRDYISFPDNSFTLDLGERARIPVTISIPADAEPGGLYGSVLVSTVRNPESPDPAIPQSPIVARVGSLFFVTVEGEIERAGETVAIDTVGQGSWFSTGPIPIGILYENSGSVHLNPYGEISITNMLGEEVGYVQLDSWFVLPQSLRLREVTWDREFLIGRYTITAKINRGYDDIVDEVSMSVWVIPWQLILGVFAVLFLVGLLWRFVVGNFELKRKS